MFCYHNLFPRGGACFFSFVQAIDTVRVLAADIVQKSLSGHPGAPMGCAPMAHVLFTKVRISSPL